MTGREFIAYAIILVGVVLLVLAAVRARRRPNHRHEHIDITSDGPEH